MIVVWKEACKESEKRLLRLDQRTVRCLSFANTALDTDSHATTKPRIKFQIEPISIPLGSGEHKR